MDQYTVEKLCYAYDSEGVRFTSFHFNEAASLGRLDLMKQLHNLHCRGTAAAIDHAIYRRDEAMIRYLLVCRYIPTPKARDWANQNGLAQLFKPKYS